jgi:hypothetical protein
MPTNALTGSAAPVADGPILFQKKQSAALLTQTSAQGGMDDAAYL